MKKILNSLIEVLELFFTYSTSNAFFVNTFVYDDYVGVFFSLMSSSTWAVLSS